MDHARSRAASRGDSRGAGRSARRERRKQRFGRFLWFTALGTLIPGTGLIAAGRRGWGRFLLMVVMIGVLGLGLVLWRVPRRRLAMTAFDRDQLTIIAIGLAIIAALWLIVALASHRALEPPGLSGGKRFAGAVVVIAAASLVVAPMTLAARYAWTQHDVIGAISRGSSTAPEVDKVDPWAGMPRVNVLLMGSDGGDGRDGVRPDTLILTSIDTETGDAYMFSLPRNLQNVPFPEDSPLNDRFPYGFQGGPEEDPLEYMINAVYRNAPALVGAEAFEGSDDPGADATKLAVSGALGIPVDYYVMANLDGFKQIVDAMGGVTIDVNYPVPKATKVQPGIGCVWTGEPDGWITPGEEKTLSGGDALWFARARCAPDHPEYADLYEKLGGNPVRDDYNRMERQRCVMAAIAERANPMTLLANFESLASAAEQNIASDIPPDLWPAFAELGVKVQKASINSLPLTKDVIEPSSPDYEQLHALIAETLEPEPDLSTTIEASNDGGSDEDSDDAADDDTDEDTTDDGVDESGPDSETDPTEAVDVSTAC